MKCNSKCDAKLRGFQGILEWVAGMKSVLPLNYHKFRCDLDSSRA